VQKASASGGLSPPDLLPGLCPWIPLRTSVPEPADWPAFILWRIPYPQNQKSPPQKKNDETDEPGARIHGWMTLREISVPICLYCLNCTKFGQLILRKINCCHQMSDFKAKMHQIRFRHFPDPLAGFKGPTSKGREVWEGKGGEGRGGERIVPLLKCLIRHCVSAQGKQSTRAVKSAAAGHVSQA